MVNFDGFLSSISNGAAVAVAPLVNFAVPDQRFWLKNKVSVFAALRTVAGCLFGLNLAVISAISFQISGAGAVPGDDLFVFRGMYMQGAYYAFVALIFAHVFSRKSTWASKPKRFSLGEWHKNVGNWIRVRPMIMRIADRLNFFGALLMVGGCIAISLLPKLIVDGFNLGLINL